MPSAGTRIVLAVLALALAGAVFVQCTATDPPTYLAESPVGSGGWAAIEAKPSWVDAPPGHRGHVRIVAEGKSNSRGICATGNRPQPVQEIRAILMPVLAPAVGEAEIRTLATAIAGRMTLVERACREEILTREMVVGNTLCTAWALWEMPVEDFVAQVPEAHRDALRAALR